ncbi:MAG: VOC family protein [Thiofilum sp.]|uniref:VOC family protein n=1 Tax=Thiofilum sp. TaxID=2212733 RepID=UPI0025E63916|nr:VOC family protein [Thiofilum sp.]MBK8454436.1 VOC family protein [Thiofilum sp.]
MNANKLDHLVITAPSLEIGTQWIYEHLGVKPQTGGEHIRMGTHNCLLKLGQDIYLEVIALNPKVYAQRPRWFGLDQKSHNFKPSLATWVINTPNIQQTLQKATEELGNIESMSRGLLNWLITIPYDGSLPLQGIAPVLIEWQSTPHPATHLTDHHLSLLKLKLFHPEPERIQNLITSLSLVTTKAVEISFAKQCAIMAYIETPQGIKLL